MKKILSILLALAFLFSLGGMPAHAQAPTRMSSYAFIPLASPDDDISVPMVFRARDAFNALAPGLLRAQARGEVVRFEPEFDHGLLKVEYRSGYNLGAALAARPDAAPKMFADPKAVLDYIQISRSLPAGLKAPAQPDPYLFVGVYDTCFSGENWGAGNQYEITLYDTAMHLLTSKTNFVDGSGNIDDCLYDTGVWNTMIPGYTFTIKQFDSHHDYPPIATYSTLIPRLNITSVTPKTKTFKGIGPASNHVWFEVIHAALDADPNDETDYYSEGPTSSKGTWSIKMPAATPIRGGDYYGIAWPDPTNITTTFVFYRGLYMPALDCQLGGDTCGAYGLPGKAAKITLTHARRNYTISGKYDFTGWYGGYFYDANTDPVFMVPGDRVSGSGLVPLIVPTLTAVPDTTADTISGVAPANIYFWVKVKAYFHVTDEWKTAWLWVESEGDGTYTADLIHNFKTDTADIIIASLYPINPLTGNETDYWNYVINP